MEPSALATLLSMALAAFLLLGLIKRKGSRRGYNLPPGPTPWPVIGNFNLIGALPHRSIHELSRKYGELMLLRFGSFPVVVGSSVAMARLILKTHDAVFIDRPRTASGKHTTYGYADITWSPYGAYWRQARRICVTELFSARRVASFEHIRADEVRALVRGLFAAASSGRSGAVYLNRDHLSTLSMNVITRMVLGKRFFGEGADAAEGPVSTLSEFKWMLDELLLLNGVLNVGDWIPWVDWMDLQGYVRRMKKVGKMFDAFMEHVLDEHSERRREGETFVAKDMVDVLMDRGVGALGAPKKTRHLCHGRSITKAAAALRNRRRTTPGTRVAASTRASSRTLTAGSASTPSRGPSAPSPSAIATLVASPHRAVHRRPPRRHPSQAAAPPPLSAAGAPGRAPLPGCRPRTVILP